MVLTTDLIDQTISDLKTSLAVLFTHGAAGDDDTAPSASDTTLGNETFRDALDEVDTSAPASVIASLRIEAGENNGNEIEEVGVFDDPAAGTMWLRNVLTTSISKTADIQVFLDNKLNLEVSEA